MSNGTNQPQPVLPLDLRDWRRWLAVILVGIVSGLGGGGAIAPLCTHAPCLCCQPNGDVACCKECCSDNSICANRMPGATKTCECGCPK